MADQNDFDIDMNQVEREIDKQIAAHKELQEKLESLERIKKTVSAQKQKILTAATKMDENLQKMALATDEKKADKFLQMAIDEDDKIRAIEKTLHGQGKLLDQLRTLESKIKNIKIDIRTKVNDMFLKQFFDNQNQPPPPQGGSNGGGGSNSANQDLQKLLDNQKDLLQKAYEEKERIVKDHLDDLQKMGLQDAEFEKKAMDSLRATLMTEDAYKAVGKLDYISRQKFERTESTTFALFSNFTRGAENAYTQTTEARAAGVRNQILQNLFRGTDKSSSDATKKKAMENVEGLNEIYQYNLKNLDLARLFRPYAGLTEAGNVFNKAREVFGERLKMSQEDYQLHSLATPRSQLARMQQALFAINGMRDKDGMKINTEQYETAISDAKKRFSAEAERQATLRIGERHLGTNEKNLEKFDEFRREAGVYSQMGQQDTAAYFEKQAETIAKAVARSVADTSRLIQQLEKKPEGERSKDEQLMLMRLNMLRTNSDSIIQDNPDIFKKAMADDSPMSLMNMFMGKAARGGLHNVPFIGKYLAGTLGKMLQDNIGEHGFGAGVFATGGQLGVRAFQAMGGTAAANGALTAGGSAAAGAGMTLAGLLSGAGVVGLATQAAYSIGGAARNEELNALMAARRLGVNDRLISDARYGTGNGGDALNWKLKDELRNMGYGVDDYIGQASANNLVKLNGHMRRQSVFRSLQLRNATGLSEGEMGDLTNLLGTSGNRSENNKNLDDQLRRLGVMMEQGVRKGIGGPEMAQSFKGALQNLNAIGGVTSAEQRYFLMRQLSAAAESGDGRLAGQNATRIITGFQNNMAGAQGGDTMYLARILKGMSAKDLGLEGQKASTYDAFLATGNYYGATRVAQLNQTGAFNKKVIESFMQRANAVDIMQNAEFFRNFTGDEATSLDVAANMYEYAKKNKGSLKGFKDPVVDMLKGEYQNRGGITEQEALKDQQGGNKQGKNAILQNIQAEEIQLSSSRVVFQGALSQMAVTNAQNLIINTNSGIAKAGNIGAWSNDTGATGHASGGLIPASRGTGVRYNGSTLHGEEYVMNPEATRRYLPLLQAMNGGEGSQQTRELVDNLQRLNVNLEKQLQKELKDGESPALKSLLAGGKLTLGTGIKVTTGTGGGGSGGGSGKGSGGSDVIWLDDPPPETTGGNGKYNYATNEHEMLALLAIMQQESGGNYSAINKDKGALGKYQVMPQNLWGPKYWKDKSTQTYSYLMSHLDEIGTPKQGWDYQYLGRDITPREFLQSQELQEKISQKQFLANYNARLKARGGDHEAAFKDSARIWYSGSWMPSDKPQGAYPTINQYASQAWSHATQIRNSGQLQQAMEHHGLVKHQVSGSVEILILDDKGNVKEKVKDGIKVAVQKSVEGTISPINNKR